MRFFAPMKHLSHMAAARFTQIDYDWEMAFIITVPGVPGEAELYGAVHLHSDPDGEEGEYSIVVRHDLTRLGLGRTLMEHMIDYARQRGIQRIVRDIVQVCLPLSDT